MINPVPISLNKIKQIRKLKSRKFRNIQKIFFCEGHRLLTAALSSKQEIIEIVVTENYLKNDNFDQISASFGNKNIPTAVCSEKEMSDLSDEVTPSGIIFLVKQHLLAANDLHSCKDKKLIYLEGVADPGNLGTIIRSALWFNIKTIILSPGCVEPTNPKVVRASAGAIFSADIFMDTEIETISNFCTQNGYEAIASTISGPITLTEWHPSEKCIVFFGSEATGLTDNALQICSQEVRIEGNEKVESLNIAIAAGIFLNKLAESVKV